MRRHIMTAKRRAALKKAQLASARKRRQNRTNSWKNMKARRKARTPAQKRAVNRELRKVGRSVATGMAVHASKQYVVNRVGRTNPMAAARLHTALGLVELGHSVYAYKAMYGKKKKTTRKKKR